MKYYRYYNARTWTVSAVTHYEYAHTLKLALGFEGTRRFDWGDTNFNGSYTGTTAQKTPRRSSRTRTSS